MYNVVNHFGIIAPIFKIVVCMVSYTALICVVFIIKQQKVTTTINIVLYNYCAGRWKGFFTEHLYGHIPTNRREYWFFLNYHFKLPYIRQYNY